MSEPSNFYTQKCYQQNSSNPLTPTMEDYLEMIYRLLLRNPVVRIGELSVQLNVKPSSSTKIVQTLKEKGYINYEQYSYISLTEQGEALGAYLYARHNILHDFFCTVNHSNSELEVVEMVEHFIDKETLENIEHLTHYLHDHKY
ncbi:MAG: iron dependent repressor, metal binding and dimerization domain protein [bacterium]|nr:iron dependent repressor, metal binding and dimerization domain protein [bacterium]